MIRSINVVVDPAVRKLCTSAYPGHPRGCPNFGEKEGCPPQALMIDKLFDLSKRVWAFWVDFDLSAHRKKMRKKHPTWSRRQLNCCLYWQGTVNKKLRETVGQRLLATNRVIYCPEACGVNVTATMETIGVILEWPPVNIVRKIALVGTIIEER